MSQERAVNRGEASVHEMINADVQGRRGKPLVLLITTPFV